MLLAGDVGGTKTDLAIFSVEGGPHAPLTQAGGIPLHIFRAAEESRFMETFTRKGRFNHFMERIPIHLILNRAALVGSAAYGLESLTKEL